MKKNRVAFVHDYLIQYGGAEKTLEALLELFPNAPIYTGAYDKKGMSEIINNRQIFYPNNKYLFKYLKYFTFLMPYIFEGFNLSEYDIIISDGTAWHKGVLTKPEQLHISYIHTPPRFLYKYSTESAKKDKWYFKPILPFIEHKLRIWDFAAAQRPDYLVTNSLETQARIKKFYSRDAQVIYPPVELDFEKTTKEPSLEEPYYLCIGRLSKYKNVHLAVQAFNLLNLNLVVAGTGIEEENLKKMANDNIKFRGKVTEKEKNKLYENCLGVIFLVEEEDLGIVPLEALAHKKPVLAHNSGGPKETIKNGVEGMFFDDLSIEGVTNAVREFDHKVKSGHFKSANIGKNIEKFSKANFQKEFMKFFNQKLIEHQKQVS